MRLIKKFSLKLMKAGYLFIGAPEDVGTFGKV